MTTALSRFGITDGGVTVTRDSHPKTEVTFTLDDTGYLSRDQVKELKQFERPDSNGKIHDVTIMDKGAGRHTVQQYISTFNKEFENIDATKRGSVSKGDLEHYLKNPNLTNEQRQMATFFNDHYDFLKGVDMYPVKAGQEGYVGTGLSHKDMKVLEALTDPNKLKTLVKDQSFSEVAEIAGFMIPATVGSTVASALVLSEGMSTGLALSLAAGTMIVTGVGAAALAAAAGAGVGYLLYQRHVREHYSAERKQLEDIMQQQR